MNIEYCLVDLRGKKQKKRYFVGGFPPLWVYPNKGEGVPRMAWTGSLRKAQEIAKTRGGKPEKMEDTEF